MRFYFKHKESAAAGIRRINRELLSAIRDIFADESLDADTGVHKLRKCSKKLRAVLRFSRPALKKRQFRRIDHAVRDFARGFSGTRDSAVMVKTFDALMVYYRPFLCEDELLPVRQALQNRHVLAMAKHQEHVSAGKVHDNVRHIEKLLGKSGDISRPQMLAGVRDVYMRGRILYRALGNDPNNENSHGLRRQAKYLWYQLTLLQQRMPEHMKSLISDLDELCELLGNDNDMAVLVATLEADPEICGNPVRAELIFSLAESRRVALLSSALRIARRVYCHRPGRFVRDLAA